MKFLPLLFLVACYTTASDEPTPGHPTLRSRCELVSDGPRVYRCEFEDAICYLSQGPVLGSEMISCFPKAPH